MKSTATPVSPTHNCLLDHRGAPCDCRREYDDFAPKVEPNLSTAHLWAEFWPQVVALIEPLHKDLALIGEMLTQINESLEQANEHTRAASDINKIQLDSIRAQMGGIARPTIVLDPSQKLR